MFKKILPLVLAFLWLAAGCDIGDRRLPPGYRIPQTPVPSDYPEPGDPDYPEDRRYRYPPDDRRYPPDDRRYPPDDRRYPPDDRRYPPDDRRYPLPDDRRDPSSSRRDREPSRDSRRSEPPREARRSEPPRDSQPSRPPDGQSRPSMPYQPGGTSQAAPPPSRGQDAYEEPSPGRSQSQKLPPQKINVRVTQDSTTLADLRKYPGAVVEPQSSGNFRRVEFYFPDRSSFAVHFTDRAGKVNSFVTTKASFRVLGNYVVQAFDGNAAAR